VKFVQFLSIVLCLAHSSYLICVDLVKQIQLVMFIVFKHQNITCSFSFLVFSLFFVSVALQKII